MECLTRHLRGTLSEYCSTKVHLKMFELRAAGWENLPSPSCWWIYWCGLTIKIVLHTLVLLHNLSDILKVRLTRLVLVV